MDWLNPPEPLCSDRMTVQRKLKVGMHIMRPICNGFELTLATGKEWTIYMLYELINKPHSHQSFRCPIKRYIGLGRPMVNKKNVILI